MVEVEREMKRECLVIVPKRVNRKRKKNINNREEGGEAIPVTL